MAEIPVSGVHSTHSASDPFTLLLVDDNAVNRELWSFFLTHQGGYRVLTADDGFKALRIVETTPLDLILLDVMMPGLDGFQVLARLRRSWTPEALPVILCTAKGHSDDVVRGFDLGANDYVAKPLDHGVVLARIQAQLRGRSPAHHLAPRAVSGIEDVRPGTVIEEKYRLESLIDQGSFGAVYRGTHLPLDRPVAIKLLATTLRTDDTSMARFQQEGISTCRLQHPNAVHIFDFSITSGGLPFLVMELLDGRPFDRMLETEGPLEASQAVGLVVPVCQVLAEAHDQGIIHRDIKPQNIYLHNTRQGVVVKVLDFGIAKIVGESVLGQRITTEGSIIGTPAYMAPERLADDTYDGRSDVFSLAVVLYEALTGRRPFASSRANLRDLMLLENRTTPPPLRSIRPEIPQALEPILAQALAQDPEQRPSASQLARQLLPLAGSAPSAMSTNRVPLH